VRRWGFVLLVLLGAGCGPRAAQRPRATLVNASGAELTDVTFLGGRGPLAPSIARIAPGDSAGDTLGVEAEDAVLVSFVADGHACVSVDSACVGRRGAYQARFVVDSTLTARSTGLRPGR
jgi:hypothetical protein